MNKQETNKFVPELRFPEFLKNKEWEEKQLNKLGQTISGLSGKSGDDFGTGKPYVTYKQVFDSAYIDFSKCAKVNIGENENQNELQKGDVLFTTSSETPNEVGFASVLIDTPIEKTYLNSFCFALRPDDLEILKPEFSRYLFHSKIYRKSISVLAQGSTRFNISKGAFLSLKLPIPKPKEQQKIADCLSSLDDIITSQNQKLDALKNHKKGLMQNLFPVDGETVPKMRFKEFKKDDDWVKIRLLDVTDKKIKWSFTGGPFGSNLKASDYKTDGIRIIQLQNIGDGKFNDEYKIFTSIEKANELLSCNIYSGDIILSKMGDPVGRACLIPDNPNRYVMSSDGIRLVVDKDNHDKYFIYSLINSTQFRSLVENNSTGSTRKRIGLDVLKNLPMIVPKNPKEQKSIADCLSSLDNQIEAETKRLEELKNHKKGLMQQLFPTINQ